MDYNLNIIITASVNGEPVEITTGEDFKIILNGTLTIGDINTTTP